MSSSAQGRKTHPNNFLHLLIRWFFHLFIHSFCVNSVHSFYGISVHSFYVTSVHSFTHSFIHPSIPSFIQSCIHSFIISSIHSFICLFNHAFIHWFIISTACPKSLPPGSYIKSRNTQPTIKLHTFAMVEPQSASPTLLSKWSSLGIHGFRTCWMPSEIQSKQCWLLFGDSNMYWFFKKWR